MKRIIYGMVFQILIGIWLLVSPAALQFKDLPGVAFNNMLLGAIVVILGLGVLMEKTGKGETFSGMGHDLHMRSTLKKF